MALNQFNAKNGLSVGATPTGVIDASANGVLTTLGVGLTTAQFSADGGFGEKLQVANPSNAAKILMLGYSEASNAGVIHAVNKGIAWMPLLLQCYGGNVVVGSTTQPSADKFQVTGTGLFTAGGNSRTLTLVTSVAATDVGLGLTSTTKEWSISTRGSDTNSLFIRDITRSVDAIRISGTTADVALAAGLSCTALSSNTLTVSGATNLNGNTFFSSNIYTLSTVSNALNVGYSNNVDSIGLWLNYAGYNGANANFRDTWIGNGKYGALLHIFGNTGRAVLGTGGNDYSADMFQVGGNITVSDPSYVTTWSTTWMGARIAMNASSEPMIDLRRWNGAATQHACCAIVGRMTSSMGFLVDTKTTNTQATTEVMTLTAAGDLTVVGQVSTAQLLTRDDKGVYTIFGRYSSTYPQAFIRASAASTGIVFTNAAATSNLMLIDNSGAVVINSLSLIGQTTEKLQVSGNAYVSGIINITSLDSIKLFGATNNQVIINDNANALQTPTGALWHDIACFCSPHLPTFETSVNGTTFTSGTLSKSFFSGNGASTQICDYATQKAVRWTYGAASSLAYSYAQWVQLNFGWSVTTPTKQVTIETSPNGSTWTTIHTSSSAANGLVQFHAIPAIGGDGYLRITIAATSAGIINLVGIKLLTTRPGDQGYDSYLKYPYTWDALKNITMSGALYANAGISSAGAIQVAGTGTITLQNTGDFSLYRSGGTTSYIYMNSANSKYLSNDGTNFNFVGGDLVAPNVRSTFFVNNSTGSIANSGGGASCLTINSANLVAGDGAFMTFIRNGLYACYFGLDTDSKLKVGGWSMGANSYEIHHDGIKQVDGWTPYFNNVTASSGGTWTKTAGTNGGWDAQVYSGEGYVTNVMVQFSAGQTTGNIMVGLNADPTTDASYASIDHAIFCNASPAIQIYEGGNLQKTCGAYATTDVLTITYDGYVVRYFQNETLLWSTPRTLVTTKMYLDTSLCQLNDKIVNLKFSSFGAKNNNFTTITTNGQVLGSALDSVVWNVNAHNLSASTGSDNYLQLGAVRTSGSVNDWTSCQSRMQMKIDTSFGPYVGMHGTGNQYGLSFATGNGTGVSSPLERMWINSSGNVLIGSQTAITSAKLEVTGSLSTTQDITLTGTGALKLPVGTTAQRPTAVKGQTRFNDDTKLFEGYDGTNWLSLITTDDKGSIAPSNQVRQTVLNSHTMPTGEPDFARESGMNFQFQNTSSTYPLTISYASGFNSYGAVDYITTNISNPSNVAMSYLNTFTGTGVACRTYSYLYADRNSTTGVPSFASTAWPCVYDYDLCDGSGSRITTDISNQAACLVNSTNGTNTYDKLYDSDITTFWASAETSSHSGVCYFGQDFGANTKVYMIVYYNNAAANAMSLIKVQYWDSTQWLDASSISINGGAGISTALNAKNIITINGTYTGTKWRVLANANIGGTNAWRVQMCRWFGHTSGQHYFEISTQRMMYFDGSTWTQKQRVMLAEACIYINTAHTTSVLTPYVLCYWLRGKSKILETKGGTLGDILTSLGGHAANKNYIPLHQIGSLIPQVRLVYKFIAQDNGFLYGEEVQVAPNYRYSDTNQFGAVSTVNNNSSLVTDIRYIYYATDTQTTIDIGQKYSATNATVVKSNLDLIFYCDRGW
jgi:hypothetical protein